MIGSTVYDEQAIGKVDDILISADGKAPYAVLSVGGFLGMGNKFIVVNTSSLRIRPDESKSDDTKFVLPGATKDSLKALPEYTYNKR
jgi:hypothetical protein